MRKTGRDFQEVASARDKEAAEYFGSEKFLGQLKEHVQGALVNLGNNCTHFEADIKPKKQDFPLIQQAFLKLQADYPELNHVRIDGRENIVLDTKKNTRFRRIMTADVSP